MITTSIFDPHSSRPRTLALGFCHRPQQGVVPTRTLLLSVALVAMFALAPRQSRAELIYTWHEDDGQGVAGSLTVASGAQQAGVIHLTDVLDFSFCINSLGFTFVTSDIPFFQVSISTTTAIPTSYPYLLSAWGPNSEINILFDEASFNPGYGEWDLAQITPVQFYQGVGHWTVTSVPEPSTLYMAGLAAVCSIAYCAASKRRATRNNSTAA